MSKEQTVLHSPVIIHRMIGFPGLNTEGIFCLVANGDNHFLLQGIAENSLLFVDPTQSYMEGKLNVFQKGTDTERQWKLSMSTTEDFSYAGRVVMSVMQYD